MFANTWYFTAEELKNSPSYRQGMAAASELLYRQITADQIQRMGRWLGVSQLTISSAIVYMHRFYVYHSFTKFHRNEIAAAALFLAAKVESQPRLLKDILKAQHSCLGTNGPDPESKEYAEVAENLLLCESILLQTIAFETNIQHPHPHVIKLCQLLHTPRDISQAAYLLATNSLHLTSMCLQYKPQVVACFCVQLAYQWANHPIPSSTGNYQHWYEAVDKFVTTALLNQMTKEFLDIYDRSETRLKTQLRLYEQELLAKARKEQVEEQRTATDVVLNGVKAATPKGPQKESPFDSGIESSASSHSRFEVPITWCESSKTYVFTDNSAAAFENFDDFVDQSSAFNHEATSDLEASPNDINGEEDFPEIHPMWTPERPTKPKMINQVQLAQSQQARKRRMREMMPLLVSEKASAEVIQSQPIAHTLPLTPGNDMLNLQNISEPEDSQSPEILTVNELSSSQNNLQNHVRKSSCSRSNSSSSSSDGEKNPSFYFFDDFVEWNTCPTPPVQSNSVSIFSPDADTPSMQLEKQAPVHSSAGNQGDRSCAEYRTVVSASKAYSSITPTDQTVKRSYPTSPAHAGGMHSNIDSTIYRAQKIRKVDKSQSGEGFTQAGRLTVRIDKSRLNMKKVMEVIGKSCDQSRRSAVNDFVSYQ